jgi:hypothetical protein
MGGILPNVELVLVSNPEVGKLPDSGYERMFRRLDFSYMRG